MDSTGMHVFNRISTRNFNDPVVSWFLRATIGNPDALIMWYAPFYPATITYDATNIGETSWDLSISGLNAQSASELHNDASQWFGFEHYAQIFYCVQYFEMVVAPVDVPKLDFALVLYNDTLETNETINFTSIDHDDYLPSGHVKDDPTTYRVKKTEQRAISSTVRPSQGQDEPDILRFDLTATYSYQGGGVGSQIDIYLGPVGVNIYPVAPGRAPEPLPSGNEP